MKWDWIVLININYFAVLKSTFDAFDVDRKGYIEADMVGTIMDMLGSTVLAEELDVSIIICSK